MANEDQWNILRILEWTSDYFLEKDIEHPRRNAEEIIAHALGMSRLDVYLNFEKPLNAQERRGIAEMVKRRGTHEPLQYIFGEAPFRHLSIKVAPSVLIPRPETETLVELALEEIKDIENPLVLDLCTGSGCVACAIASERSDARVVASDISEVALSISAENAEFNNLHDRIEFVSGDLAIPSEIAFDLIVSNPPYIPSSRLESLDNEVREFEPMLALDGGAEGLDVFDRILEKLRGLKDAQGHRPSCILELDETHLQKAKKNALITGDFDQIHVLKDLTGRDRFLKLV